MAWFVYILECSDGTYYTGITTDLKRRVAEHETGKGAKYTKGRSPLNLVYFEETDDRSLASKRECEIKAMSKHEKALLLLTG